MARFEVTISGGARILVNHPAAGMRELLAELAGNEFLLLKEIRGDTSLDSHEVIVASRQITLVRTIEDDSRQSTSFRPKR